MRRETHVRILEATTPYCKLRRRLEHIDSANKQVPALLPACDAQRLDIEQTENIRWRHARLCVPGSNTEMLLLHWDGLRIPGMVRILLSAYLASHCRHQRLTVDTNFAVRIYKCRKLVVLVAKLQHNFTWGVLQYVHTHRRYTTGDELLFRRRRRLDLTLIRLNS